MVGLQRAERSLRSGQIAMAITVAHPRLGISTGSRGTSSANTR